MTAQILGVLDLASVPPAAGEPAGPAAGGPALDAAIERGRQLVAAGAHRVGLVARGGGAVSAEDLGAVVAGLAALAPVALTTDDVDLARAAVSAGATVLDDTDGVLEPVAVEAAGAVGLILVHRPAADHEGRRPAAHQVALALADRARRVADAGVAEVWIDPGPVSDHDLDGGAVLAGLDHLIATGWPVAIDPTPPGRPGSGGEAAGGAGRAGAVAGGEGLDTAASVVDDGGIGASSGSVAAAAYAVTRGAALVRARDVKAISQAVVVASGYTQFRRA